MKKESTYPAPRIEEWQDLKFGMFIHWGLYSVMIAVNGRCTLMVLIKTSMLRL